MLKIIIQSLKYQEINKSESIDIAKGKYKLPTNLKEIKEQTKWQ